MDKTIEDTLLDRRSVRRYAREPIADDDLEFIRQAIRNTPTSYNGQQFSVIEVADRELKLKLEAIIGQKQIKTSARVFFFLSDFNKIAVAARAKGLEYPAFETTADGLIVGVVDASLAMMSAIVAANARGLGTCPIGYARTVDPAAISKVLELPEGTFVVCALAVGVPSEMPDLKPKQPLDLMIFRDKYGTAEMADKLLDYDRAFAEYHRTRSGNQSDEAWVDEILGYYREAMKYRMLKALQARGYTMDH